MAIPGVCLVYSSCWSIAQAIDEALPDNIACVVEKGRGTYTRERQSEQWPHHPSASSVLRISETASDLAIVMWNVAGEILPRSNIWLAVEGEDRLQTISGRVCVSETCIHTAVEDFLFCS